MMGGKVDGLSYSCDECTIGDLKEHARNSLS